MLIAENSLLKQSSIKLKLGVSPFTVLDLNSNLSLNKCGIKHGDTLIIETIDTPKSTSNNDNQVKFLKRTIADDNSCLFNAIGYVLLNQAPDQSMALRMLIADTVRSNPHHIYTATYLGTQSVDDYIRLITAPSTWGGAIELAIFAQHFQTEIVSIDVETTKPYHFGEGSGYGTRVYILYSGIHYDALVQSTSSGDITTFPSSGDEADMSLISALSVAEEEKRLHRYTNTKTFSLQCADCMLALVGQTEAQDHCRLTGHANFQEYKKL